MEFAIVLPVLILIILGILYFGRYENYSSQETQLAQQAARYAAVDVNPSLTPGTQSLQQYVVAQASPELASGSPDVAKATVYIYYPTSDTTPNDAVGNSVRACVVTTAQLPFLGTSAKIVQNATMRIEVADGTNNRWTNDTTATALAAGCPTS